MNTPASITCPKCGRTSHHPRDVEEGYCGACHEFTSQPHIVRKLIAGAALATERFTDDELEHFASTHSTPARDSDELQHGEQMEAGYGMDVDGATGHLLICMPGIGAPQDCPVCKGRVWPRCPRCGEAHVLDDCPVECKPVRELREELEDMRDVAFAETKWEDEEDG